MTSDPARPLVSPRFLALHKRRRVIHALAELCVEQGYRRVTVAKLCRQANLARATYYQHFPGLDAALLAAVETGMGEASQLAEDACRAASGPFEERLRAVLAALLDLIARRPEMAWVCLVEAPVVRPFAAGPYDAALRRFAESIRMMASAGPLRPRATAADFVVGGIVSIIHARLRHGEAESVPALLPDLSEFALATLRDATA